MTKIWLHVVAIIAVIDYDDAMIPGPGNGEIDRTIHSHYSHHSAHNDVDCAAADCGGCGCRELRRRRQ